MTMINNKGEKQAAVAAARSIWDETASLHLGLQLQVSYIYLCIHTPIYIYLFI